VCKRGGSECGHVSECSSPEDVETAGHCSSYPVRCTLLQRGEKEGNKQEKVPCGREIEKEETSKVEGAKKQT